MLSAKNVFALVLGVLGAVAGFVNTGAGAGSVIDAGVGFLIWACIGAGIGALVDRARKKRAGREITDRPVPGREEA